MKKECIFCSLLNESQTIAESEYFKLIYDIDPIQMGHLLLISKKHYMNILEVPNEVLFEMVLVEKKIIGTLNKYMRLNDFSIILNNGNIMDKGTHFHVHIVPRYESDFFWDNQQVKKKYVNTDKIKKILNSIDIGK